MIAFQPYLPHLPLSPNKSEPDTSSDEAEQPVTITVTPKS